MCTSFAFFQLFFFLQVSSLSNIHIWLQLVCIDTNDCTLDPLLRSHGLEPRNVGEHQWEIECNEGHRRFTGTLTLQTRVFNWGDLVAFNSSIRGFNMWNSHIHHIIMRNCYLIYWQKNKSTTSHGRVLCRREFRFWQLKELLLLAKTPKRGLSERVVDLQMNSANKNNLS